MCSSDLKLEHAIGFLCEDMKVKLNLRFKGREMAHTEIGFQVVNKFLAEVAPWGHPDNPPKLTGRTINVMVSPQPKNKRAKNPKGDEKPTPPAASTAPEGKPTAKSGGQKESTRVSTEAASSGSTSVNNPFANLSLEDSSPEQTQNPAP